MTRAAKQFRIFGLTLLVVGLLAGVIIYVTARPDVSPGILGVDIRTNRDRMQLERMGGKGYVMFKDIDDWFAGLWRGPRLGCTIGVLSVLGFLLCRGLAYVEDDIAKTQAKERESVDQVSDTSPPSEASSPPPQELPPPPREHHR